MRRAGLIAALGLLAGGMTGLRAADPAWWSGGVIHPGETAGTTNYEPANLGQLKNMADQARKHLNARLAGAGGSGPAIESLLAAWPDGGAGNYAPVNLGQLKNVADKFYARLDAVGFNFKPQLLANGYAGTWTVNPTRPWSGALAVDNYAPANLGQLKILFSFDLSAWTVTSDGLPIDWKQAIVNASLQDGDPGNDLTSVAAVLAGDDFDHDGLTNAQEFAAGTAATIKDHPLVDLKVFISVP